MSDAHAEEEAPVYRGKTLTPESPRPLHAPSPSNIPVLEHQIDPIFNLMSTHIDQSQGQKAVAPADTTQETDPQLSADEDIAGQAASDHVQFTDTNATDFDLTHGAHATEAQTEEAVHDLDPSSAANPGSEISSAAAAEMPLENVDVDPTSRPDHEASEGSNAPEMSAMQETQTVAMPMGERTEALESAHDVKADGAPVEQSTNVQITGNVANPDLQALMKSLQVPLLVPLTENAPPPGSLDDAQTSSTGLPPRPPPQEKSSIHPNYEADADIRSFHFPTAIPHISSATSPSALASVSGQGGPPGVSPQQELTAGSSLLPPPALNSAPPAPGTAVENLSEDTEKAWRTFQDEESVFTAEGAWEKFPHGSRLFVGNLPTENVSRREVFNIFYKYGKLAQISIKQAYGFVQFMDVESCQKAMKAEQGARIRERNMHLEISKPPKNNRGGNNNNSNNNNNNNNSNQASNAGDRIRERHRRDRSRSPNRRNRGSRGGGGGGGGGSNGNNNNNNNSNNNNNNNNNSGNNASGDMRYSDFRDEPRRGRDDYRPGRSPSPRRGDGYRPRDRSTDRHYDGRRRSRSPYRRNAYGRRSPSPRRSGLADDELPLPRRAPRDVPDVQIILVEEVSRPFVEYVVGGFQSKGIRCDVLSIPRVPLEAIVRRQIVEGVVAVCSLTQREERTGKVPLQVFDRSRGSHDVRFEEYEDIEMPIAAALVLRAKSNNMPPTPTYGTASGNMPYVPPYMQQQVAAAAHQGSNANLQSLITSLDPATLQQLVGVVGQPQSGQTANSTPTQAGFPSQFGSHQQMMQQQQQQQQQQQREQQMRLQGQSAPGYQYASPTQTQQSVYPYGAPPQSQQPPPQGQYGQHAGQTSTNNVQSIMEQLASIQRQG